MADFPETTFIPVPLLAGAYNAVTLIGAAGDIAYRHGKRGDWSLNANPSP